MISQTPQSKRVPVDDGLSIKFTRRKQQAVKRSSSAWFDPDFNCVEETVRRPRLHGGG